MPPAPLRLVERIVPPAGRSLPRWTPPLAALLSVGVVVLGVWVTGGLLTDDEALAKMLTGAWFVLAGAVAVAIGLRWRQLGIAVVSAWLVSSVVVGGFLLQASTRDRVVDEQVAVAPAPAPTVAAPTPAAAEPAATPQPEVPRAEFRDGAHPTSGVATLVPLAGGERVLTLTRFRTDPGPDLRVYLLPDREGRATDRAVDLGGLKGNRGDQQYAVPADAEAGSVVIWCRAFSVAFGTASF